MTEKDKDLPGLHSGVPARGEQHPSAILQRVDPKSVPFPFATANDIRYCRLDLLHSALSLNRGHPQKCTSWPFLQTKCAHQGDRIEFEGGAVLSVFESSNQPQLFQLRLYLFPCPLGLASANSSHSRFFIVSVSASSSESLSSFSSFSRSILTS